MTEKNVGDSFSTCCFSSWTTSKIVAFKLEAPAYLSCCVHNESENWQCSLTPLFTMLRSRAVVLLSGYI